MQQQRPRDDVAPSATLNNVCREVSESTKGVAGALEAIAYYQRRSDAVLVHLLGRSYGASDVLVNFHCVYPHLKHPTPSPHTYIALRHCSRAALQTQYLIS